MKKLHLATLVIASASMILMTGCANKTQSGAAIGAGTGAILGQVIGGNTASTLAGAAIGGLAGGAIGHHEDKKDRRYYKDERGSISLCI
jgi:uncharacterized protein YcfJ